MILPRNPDLLFPYRDPSIDPYVYLENRLNKLALPLDWNGSHFVQIAPATIELARTLLSLCKDCFPDLLKHVQISPDYDGDLWLTFLGNHEGKELELWIQGEASPIRYLQVHKGATTQGTCSTLELTDLFSWLVEDLRTCACKFSSRSPVEHCVQCYYPFVQLSPQQNEGF